VALRDLGQHHLKDLDSAEHILQLVAPDLDANFPPLGTLEQPSISHAAPAVLATRLYVPRDRPTLLSRPRLLARLDAGLEGPLTLI